MENASKALLMAGGILIAILILGSLVLLFQNIGIIPKSQDETEEVEQLAKFNEQWESYNKKQMYGTDVVTIINKAIENNRKYKDDSELFEKYKIDVIFTLETSLQTTIYTFENSSRVSTDTNDDAYFKGTNKKYYLIDNSDDKINDNLLNLMQGSKVIYNKKNDYNYTVTYSSFSDFKRRYFKCNKITYKDNGTVSTIEFEQIGLTNY